MMNYTSLIKEVNIPELVKALRECASDDPDCIYNCPYYNHDVCADDLKSDAAAAIEELQAEVKRLKECNDELREAQTYIDHYGDKWLTSAKDVPTSAYNHGYMDGKNEAEAQLTRQGEWIWIDKHTIQCPLCHRYLDLRGVNAGRGDANYCPNCGVKMEVQDGQK